MRPRNALGYRRHPFRQPGDVDHARGARFPGLPHQLGAGLASGSRAVISELDIYRAANLLIHQHGPNAELEATLLAALMRGRGDHEGLLAWMRIGQAITVLQATPAGMPH